MKIAYHNVFIACCFGPKTLNCIALLAKVFNKK